jgi:hypothetical protein
MIHAKGMEGRRHIPEQLHGAKRRVTLSDGRYKHEEHSHNVDGQLELQELPDVV